MECRDPHLCRSPRDECVGDPEPQAGAGGSGSRIAPPASAGRGRTAYRRGASRFDVVAYHGATALHQPASGAPAIPGTEHPVVEGHAPVLSRAADSFTLPVSAHRDRGEQRAALRSCTGHGAFAAGSSSRHRADRPAANGAALERPLVSVVIPNHNLGHLLGEAVGSVLEQTFQDFELIIVDSSTDQASRTEAGRLSTAAKTRVYLRPERHLVGDNRNFGIARARGKYVCCLDATTS